MTNKIAHAGTLESCDALVSLQILDKKQGVVIDFKTANEALYSEHIKQLVKDKLTSLKLPDVKITIDDKGALDETIIARINTAYARIQAK